MTFIRLIFLPVFLLLSFPLLAQKGKETIRIFDDRTEYMIGKKIQFFVDEDRNKTIYEISSDNFDGQFKHSKEEHPNFGFSDHAYWVRFTIDNQTSDQEDFFLEINYPLLDSVEFYYKDAGGWKHRRAGDMFSFSQRQIRNRHLLFPLKIPVWEERTYYLRVVSQNSQVQMPMSIWHPIAFDEHNHQSQFIFGIIYGIILLIIIDDLFLFFTIGNRSYLYYVFAMLSSLLLITALNGHAFEYLWPNWVWFQNHGFPILMVLLGLWLAVFCRSFLETKTFSRFLDRTLYGLIISQAVLLVLNFFLPYEAAFYVSLIPTCILALILLVTGGVGISKGNKSARYFVVAFSVYILGFVVNVLRTNDLVIISFITEYSAQFGAAFQVTVLSFALGSRFKQLRGEKAKAQKEALELQQEINEKLEEKVLQRTLEIEQKAEELERSNKNITILSSIGQEITSSLNVEDIFSVLYSYVNDLMDASFFGIDVYYAEQNILEYKYNIEKGKRLPVEQISISGDRDNLSVWSVLNKQPILINDIDKEHTKYIKKYKVISGERPNSAIFVPLIVGDRVLGVVTAQSFEKNAYTSQHLEVMKNLASYTSAALDNATAYGEVKTTNTKMMNSIRYAQRIQEAVLEKPEKVLSSFREGFIFYRPRDIVSGDFYWYTRKDHLTFLAVVDCTGHGVPGAFMTMMGNDLLNQIILEAHEHSPDMILKKLDEKVRATLHVEGKNSGRSDGMDAALLVVDEKKKNIHFAGAKLPLYYIQHREMQSIKGSRSPIGGVHYGSDDKVYPVHTIKYNDGDVFYLFSDGYQDQFGGPEKRKYLTKRFRNLLYSISLLPMKRQEETLAKELHQWQNGERQTDDILVVGLKM